MSKRLGVLAAVVLLAIAGMGQTTAPTTAKATYSISGCVLDAHGQPLSNAEIYLSRIPEGAQQGIGQESLLAGSAGRFRFTGLLPGKYTVLAAKRGFVAQTYGMREDYFIGIAVGPGMDEPELVLRLEAEGSIAGTVLGDDDAPLRKAEIWLFRRAMLDGLERTLTAEQTRADERGGYRFSHLPAGRYYLAVKAESEFSSYLASTSFVPARPDIGELVGELPEPGNAGPALDGLPPELDLAYPLTFFPEASKAANAETLVLRAGEKLRADFHLQAVRAIHVKVPSETNTTFRVRAFEDEELELGSVPLPSGATGWKTLAVAPGKYSVGMEFCAHEAEACVNGRREMELTADITIDNDQVVDDTARISGTAIRDDGRPVPPYVEMILTPLRSISLSRRIPLMPGEVGKFSWSGELTKASYAIECQSPDFSIKSLATDGAKVRGKTIEVRGGGLLTLAVVLTSNSSQVKGKVVNAGRPVAGVLVLMVPQDFENNMPFFRRDESDSDGTFLLPPVPPGNYIAVALEHGWEIEWAKPEVLKPYLAKGQPVRLRSAATADIILELQ